MPLFEVGALSTLMEGEIATAALADTMSTAALADVGMGAGAGITGEALTGAAGMGLAGSGLSGAGGLASLPGALTSVLPEVGAVNPEIAAQVADFANVGAVPPVAPAGGIPSALPGVAGSAMPSTAAPLSQGIQGLQAGNFAQQIPAQYQTAMSQLGGLGQYPGTQLAMGPMTASDVGGIPGMAQNAQAAANWAAPSEASAWDAATSGAYGGPAGMPPSAEAAAWDAATAGQYGGPAEAAKTGFSFGNPLKSIYDVYKDQDPLTQGVMKYGGMGLGALQAAKYLNKTPGAYSPPGYSGPLSKINISPNYRPYSYRPYAAGGPVEEMSRENAIGANTGYPQADINQGAYATPWQTPVSRNVVTGPSDANVDQMTGLERMARGGVAHFDGGGAAGGDSSSGGDSAATSSDDSGGVASLAYSPSMYSSSLYAPEMSSLSMYSPMMYSPSMMSTSLVDPAAAYAAAQPVMDLPRQNFQNFLSQYRNLPGMTPQEIADWSAAHPPAIAPTSTPAAYDPYAEPFVGLGTGEATGLTNNTGGGTGAKAGGLMASGGISTLGSYSDGGRLLRGPGDGMSDNIPASISGKQPARLADGEFVVPADVVSGLGNGSTDAGARHLYSMMDKVRKARTGTKKQGKQINPRKYVPA